MKKFRQFEVGKIAIRKDGENLIFDGTYCAKNPKQVIMAILKVSRYLKWHNGPFISYVFPPERKPYIANVTASHSGKTIYVNHREVMHICSTGNASWACLSKKQIVGAINDCYYNKNVTLIPECAFDLLNMLSVQKLDPFVEFAEEDFWRADEMFVSFLKTHCPKAGEYSFENEYFQKETGLPTQGLVWHYLTNRADILELPNELWVVEANQQTDKINFTLLKHN